VLRGLAVMALTLLAVACSPGQPSGEPESGPTGDEVELAHSQCMRDHGVEDWPDPVFTDGDSDIRLPEGFDLESPEVREAEAECASVRQGAEPGSGGDDRADRDAVEAEMDAMLEFAACMRDQGIDFPDPVLGEDGISGPAGPLDGDQASFDQAREICEEQTRAPMP
jgi:hypothetical protein